MRKTLNDILILVVGVSLAFRKLVRETPTTAIEVLR